MGFLNAVEWWRLLVVGFLLGAGVTCIAIWALSHWAGKRNYVPGPFARFGEYRMSPPTDDAA